MEGPKIVMAWKEWLDSIEGRKASDPYSLGAGNGARQYLENRLQNAFLAGVKAAEQDAEVKAKVVGERG